LVLVEFSFSSTRGPIKELLVIAGMLDLDSDDLISLFGLPSDVDGTLVKASVECFCETTDPDLAKVVCDEGREILAPLRIFGVEAWLRRVGADALDALFLRFVNEALD
jgi:hypothetical protein